MSESQATPSGAENVQPNAQQSEPINNLEQASGADEILARLRS